jgi:hypothetical protein
MQKRNYPLAWLRSVLSRIENVIVAVVFLPQVVPQHIESLQEGVPQITEPLLEDLSSHSDTSPRTIFTSKFWGHKSHIQTSCIFLIYNFRQPGFENLENFPSHSSSSTQSPQALQALVGDQGL